MLEYPRSSPDLNPIENAWNKVQEAHSTNIQTLKEVLMELWVHIDAEYFRKFAESMPNMCGAGVYNNRVKYLLWFSVNSITPLMLFLQVTTSSCQTSNGTHDVLFACPDATRCYAVDLLDKVLHLYSTLIKTMYTYERKLLCSTFIMEYNFVRYNIIATMLVVVVNPLLPAYWGESVFVALWGFAASFSRQSSSRAATPEGSLHKSRADSVVGICGQLKRCCVVCS